MKRRLFALMIALVLIVSFTVPAFAAENGSTVYSASIHLHAYPGHMYIVFENDSFSTLRIGSYDVRDGETITLGVFQRDAHDGIWDNLELQNFAENEHDYLECISVSYDITAQELSSAVDAINGVINSGKWNTYDSAVGKHCIGFAIAVWNAVAAPRITFQVSGTSLKVTNRY